MNTKVCETNGGSVPMIATKGEESPSGLCGARVHRVCLWQRDAYIQFTTFRLEFLWWYEIIGRKEEVRTTYWRSVLSAMVHTVASSSRDTCDYLQDVRKDNLVCCVLETNDILHDPHQQDRARNNVCNSIRSRGAWKLPFVPKRPCVYPWTM